MVVVDVRDEYRVELVEELGGERRSPAEVEDPGTENRIGEEPGAAQLEQDGGVSEPADAVAAAGGGHARASAGLGPSNTSTPSARLRPLAIR